ncbi:hypothetical protein L873DRAFT_82510 [Choiromyces venosus 120613-1]|uniref:Uncharacterized protein n=1 Tax=Choiromyces venosus 120613-1 TaxID=1336337 RepID=A0A3N4J4T1_9PEZI|nr:hypothetical protein L873DRAFT_82510 [Choiromyces venosus 120613-1]
MPRPTRASSRKPPAGEEAAVAEGKKVTATTIGRKEKKGVVEKEIAAPVPAPVRATRSRGTVEVVIETGQAIVASSPDKPTTTRRRGGQPHHHQQPVVEAAAAVASPPKRSTRSTAKSTSTVEKVIRKTPSPKKPTRAKAPLHKKQKSTSRIAPPTPEITTSLSPEIQVPASSDAENRSPHPPLTQASNAYFASSPPAILSTAHPLDDDEDGFTTPTQTKAKDGTKKRVTLEFAEDEGYTPPRARPSSAERPRLRELGVESLEPLDRFPGIDEDGIGGFDDEEEEGGPASPTPKRANRWKLSQLAEEEEARDTGGEADLEDNDGIPTSAQKHRNQRFGSPFRFQKGKKKDTLPPPPTIAIPEGEDMTFAIYSDPNTPSPTLPSPTHARKLDEIMRPPMSSSSAQESPRHHSRKRRSSSAGADSADDEKAGEARSKQTRGGAKRRKQTTVTRAKSAAKPKMLQTEELRGLLPKRKGRGRLVERDEFDLPPSSSEEEEDEEEEESEGDELSKPTKRKPQSKPEKSKKSKSKPTPATKAAKVTKSAWSRPLVPPTSAMVKNKYARKSTGSEKENVAPRRNVGDEGEETTTTGTVVELADGVLGKEGRRKLRDQAEKFRIVDAWEMEFEDISASGDGEGRVMGLEEEVA